MKTLVAFLLLVGSAAAQTTLTSIGVSNTTATLTLTRAMSPITVTGPANLVRGTLIIEAGVEVIMPSGGSITVNGTGKIFVRGTELEPCLIRSANPTILWQGVVCNDTSSTSDPMVSLQNLVLVNGGSGVSPCVLTLCGDCQLNNVDVYTSRVNLSATPITGIRVGGGVIRGVISDSYVEGPTTGIVVGNGLAVSNTEIRNTVTPVVLPNPNIKISVVGL